MSSERYILKFVDDDVAWWDYLYYRNYKFWNNSLSETDLIQSMNT